MKKIVSLLLALLCLLPLASCSDEEETKNKNKELFTPLFRFTVSEGTSEDTKLFYLDESDGFLYLHKKDEGGFTAGFVSPSRSISVENLAQGGGDINSVTVWEKEKDCAYILSGRELILAVIKENLSHTTAVPDTVYTQGNLPFDSLSFFSESENLVLLHPVDFSQTYVLCNKTALPDYAGLLSLSDNGKKIWYTRKDNSGNFIGIAFFEYGKNTPLGSVDFPFDSFQKVGGDAVLFTEKGEKETTYRYLDLESGEEKIFTAKDAFDTALCDRQGKVLCGTEKQGDGGVITVIDFDTGKEKGTYTIDYGTPAKSLAIDKKATTLLLAFGDGKDQILATLDLTKF